MDADQYLFVDLGARYYVTAIATQGRRAAKEYVTIYNIMYSDNGHNWFYYTNEDKIIVVSVNGRESITCDMKFVCRISSVTKMIMELFEITCRIRLSHVMYDLIQDNGIILFQCVSKCMGVHSVRIHFKFTQFSSLFFFFVSFIIV